MELWQEIFPPVRQLLPRGSFFTLPPKATLRVSAPTGEGLRCLRCLESALPLTIEREVVAAPECFELALTGGPDTNCDLTLQLDGEEAYALTVTSQGIFAKARTSLGLYRAATTLAQVLRLSERTGQIPCVELQDAPRLAVRGLMMDVSRGRIYSLDTLRAIVDTMAQLKMNRLELYFEAAFAYTGHEKVWQQSSPYSPSDMLQLDAYCKERFIALVPNQNTLGHFERWFRHGSPYRDLAEKPEGGVRTPWGSVQVMPTGLCTTDERAYAFVASLLQELLPNFSADEVNLGGDEVFDLGLGRSAGRGSKAELYLQYMGRVAELCRSLGKKPTLWADMLLHFPEVMARVAERFPDATWALWGYEAGGDFMNQARLLAEHQIAYLVSPGTSSWRSFCGRTKNALANIQEAIDAACAFEQGRGILLTDWGDAGHTQPLLITVGPLAAAACLAWNPTFDLDTLPRVIDTLTGVNGIGALTLELGNTYQLCGVEVGNATQLFKALFNPPTAPLLMTPEALTNLEAALVALAPKILALPKSLWSQELVLALELQSMALSHAQGKLTKRALEKVLALLQLQWLARGPRAQLDTTLADLRAILPDPTQN